MQHFLDSSCIVPSFDNVKSDTITYFKEGTVRFFEGDRFAFPDWVNGVCVLKFFCSLFLHLQISFISGKRVSINRLISNLLWSFFLSKKVNTRLIGLRYFLTC